VFAGGIYIETGYGSSFTGVRCLDGVPVTPPPDNVPDTDPATCDNGQPEDLQVTFFVGEFSTGFSFLAHEKFVLGLALRLPFSKQSADLYQNVDALPGRPFPLDDPKRLPVGERLIFQHLNAHDVDLAYFEPPAVRMHDYRLPRVPVWTPADG